MIADIHFTPNAAETAARIVEKVRVNPGNYVDKKKFEIIEYTDDDYNAEIERIYERFSPLVKNMQGVRHCNEDRNQSRFALGQDYEPLWRYSRRNGGVSFGIPENLPRPELP